MIGRTQWVVASITLFVLTAPAFAQRDPWTWMHRYHFDIDAKTQIAELLPTAPRPNRIDKLQVADLANVPEVMFETPYVFKADPKKQKELDAARQRALIHLGRQFAQINLVNKKKPDHFMECLQAHRPDLSGLPFTLGQACRIKENERPFFRNEIHAVRGCLLGLREDDTSEEGRKRLLAPFDPDAKQLANFWRSFDSERREATVIHQLVGFVFELAHPDHEPSAVAALMQMLGPLSSRFHPGLIERLARYERNAESKERSTQALTRLAIFAQEESTRQAALAALKKRDANVVTPILVHGLRYPWPAVARNAATAIVELKRNDLAGELVKMLDESDPRAPATKSIDGRKVSFVRELVRINHHRNCLLCHPPGNDPEIFGPVADKGDPPDTLGIKGVRSEQVGLRFLNVGADMAPQPLPGAPFPRPAEGYGRFLSPDILVRADATYLRQDFSLLQKVANADPWPEMQRFDFLVRTRVVSEAEAKTYRAEFAGATSPYRSAALNALRRLMGLDAGTTSHVWRAKLRLP